MRRAPSRAAAPVGRKCCKTPYPDYIDSSGYYKKGKDMAKKGRDEGNQIKMMTFNCQGLVDTSRLYELQKALEGQNFDIMGISETRRKGERILEDRDGNYFFYFGDTRGFRGTGFYIHKRWKEKIVMIKGISDRLSILKLEIEKGIRMLVVQVYAPTQQAESKEAEEFYGELQEVLGRDGNIITSSWGISMLNWGVTGKI